MDAIVIRQVSKRFDRHVAVDGLSLSVPRGSVYGFIGPNGSGKTTTLRMIMGILLPDSGEIELLGERSTARAMAARARDRVGYLPEERGLYKKMTVRRLLRYYGRLKGVSADRIDGAIGRWLDRLALGEWADRKIETLSKGMAQKVQLIGAAVADPEVLILDEPFSGLDPVNVEVLKDTVLELRKSGVTILFSTHDMAMAERLCDRIGMIFRGRKVLDGTLEEIQAVHGHDTVRVRTAGGVEALGDLPGVAAVRDHGNEQELELDGDAQQVLRALLERTAVHQFEIGRPSLHDIFIRIARPEPTDAGAGKDGAHA
jgi:ABC-2 type transport system ATP-binding protein